MCLVTQSCPTLCDPMVCSSQAPLSMGILQARILECVSSSRGSSQPKDWTQVSCIAGIFFTSWATREAQSKSKNVSLFHMKSESEVTQSCPTLCNPMEHSSQTPLSLEFSRQKYWSGLPFLSLGDLQDLGFEPWSLALQAGSLPAELPGCVTIR